MRAMLSRNRRANAAACADWRAMWITYYYNPVTRIRGAIFKIFCQIIVKVLKAGGFLFYTTIKRAVPPDFIG
jgi:hypothetical protein